MIPIAELIYGDELTPELEIKFNIERHNMMTYINGLRRQGHISADEHYQLKFALHYANLEQLQSINKTAIKLKTLTAHMIRHLIPYRLDLPKPKLHLTAHQERNAIEVRFIKKLNKLYFSDRRSTKTREAIINQIPFLSTKELLSHPIMMKSIPASDVIIGIEGKLIIVE